MTSLQQRFSQVRQDISDYSRSCGRKPDSVQLLAASKTQTAATLRRAFALGQRAFGENYVQEAREKQDALADLPIEWHFIGPIQSNKTQYLAQNFAWVHSIDRLKIAERLDRQRPASSERLNICLQVNIDNETTKSGVGLESLAALATAVATLPNLTLRGLMAIPAPQQAPAQQRAGFEQLAQALHQLQTQWPQMDTLSMGMSADLAPAIAAGATIVRIGTGLFGPRPTGHKRINQQHE